ncbi:MAG: dihydrodipicolinate synthase family protein [Planctomycetales bacterium]
MATSFGGVWPALLTPLDDRGQVNHSALEQLVELFVRQNLGGLYVTGSTGQGPLLSNAERLDVIERVVKTSAGRIPVMAHVGAVSTDDAVLMARRAAELGADALSSVTPIYYSAAAEITFEHYRRIGAASDKPFFVYHLSGAAQFPLPPREYVQRLLEIPHIAGMKVTDRDTYLLGLLASFSGEQLQLFSGADEVLCQAAVSGACGAIGTFFNIWGPQAQDVRRRFLQGDIAAGRKFMAVFQQVIDELLRTQRVWTFLRAAMRLRHQIEIGLPRPPLGLGDRPISDAETLELVDRVESAAV